jgi:hypothetical protein
MAISTSRFDDAILTLNESERKELALAINPIKFAQLLGIDPDPWQRKLLTSEEKKIILNCARQSGKSTITAIIALHSALYNPNSLVLIISRGYRQSTELFKKVADFYQERGRPVPSDAENKHTLELTNGSRIISLPSKPQTVRGFSAPSLMIIDEAAQIEDDELYYGSLRPMLAVSQGRLILLSTPFGRRGFFYESWNDYVTDNLGGWQGFKVTAYECPRISKAFLKEEKAVLGEWWFRQEYMCEFSENVEQYFSDEEIQESVSEDVKPLFINGELSL